MGMTYEQKIREAKRIGIDIPDNLLKDKNIVGIYEFFKIKGNEEICFYIGKSTSIAYRLLGSSNGHIYMYLNNDFSKLVPLKINEYLNEGYKIKVKILEVDYNDTSFSKAAHRLALAELQEIVKYQEIGQCEFQTPEGAGTYEEKYWEENYNNNKVREL